MANEQLTSTGVFNEPSVTGGIELDSTSTSSTRAMKGNLVENSDATMESVAPSDALPNETVSKQGETLHPEGAADGDDALPTDTVEQVDGVEHEDVASSDPDQTDKFKLKKLISCAAKKLFPKDEDKVPYGKVIPEDEWQYANTNASRDKNVPSETNRNPNNKISKKDSLRKSLHNPVPIKDTPWQPGNEMSNEQETNPQTKVPDPYPCQTNVQIHPNPRSPRSRVSTDEDQYDFSHPERGYMVMIVNDRFTRQLSRDGAHWDLLKMKEVARKLGFRLFNNGKERNLSKTETLKLLRRAQQADHSKCDCFMFMISTHGLEQPNVRARGKPDHALVCADDQLIFTSSILEMFNDENCPSLRNKPKLFIIQACRGEQLDHGSKLFVAYNKRSVDVTDITRLPLANIENDKRSQTRDSLRSKASVDEIDTKPGPGTWKLSHPLRTGAPQYCVPKVKQNTGAYPYVSAASSKQINKIYAPTPYAIVDTPSLRCDTDMLVMYAIPEGMFAWRNTSDGSWMIDYIHQVFMAYDMRRPKNLLSLLTKVSAIMSRRTTNTPSSKHMDQKKAIPVIEHKLMKDVIFQQKVVGSDWIKLIKH